MKKNTLLCLTLAACVSMNASSAEAGTKKQKVVAPSPLEIYERQAAEQAQQQTKPAV